MATCTDSGAEPTEAQVGEAWGASWGEPYMIFVRLTGGNEAPVWVRDTFQRGAEMVAWRVDVLNDRGFTDENIRIFRRGT